MNDNVKELIPKSLLDNNEFIKAKELSKNGYHQVVKYINSIHPELGLILSKAYYELYIENTKDI